MDAQVATLIPAAVGVALSPIALVELILVLFSRRRSVNAVTFVAALLVFTVVLLLLGAAGGRAADSESGGPSTVIAVIFTALGLLLFGLGLRNWRNRHDTSEPAVMATIAGMGPAAVAFLAFGATFVNPKNTVLLLAAGQSVGSTSSPWLYGAVFTLVATSPYLVATGYALLGGPASHARLDRMRTWLVSRNRLLMGVICMVLGLVLVTKGITAL